MLAVLVPLTVNLWGQQPFELSRAALARTLVWALAGLALADALLARRLLWPTRPARPLLAPLGLLALALIVTTATAANPVLSLWGSYDRAQGAVTLLTYLLLCLLVADYRRDLTAARRLLAALAAAGIPLVLLGLLQRAGWTLPGLVSDARSPVYATLGRANFLGAYLALLAPPTLALLLIAGDRARRGLWAALLTGELVVIGLTQARSAWLATAVALALFALLWWGPRLAPRRRRAAWLGACLLAAGGPLIVLSLGERLGGAIAARLAIWQGTLALIGRRPLLGYGADALGPLFPRVYPPELVYYQGREVFVDRAHNLLLDWAVTAGLPGLLAFALVLGTFVLVVGRALRRPLPPARRALLIAALAAVLGNAVNNLLSFDVTATAVAAWLLMGLGVAQAGGEPSPADAPLTVHSPRRWAAVALVFAAIALAAWQLNARPVLADVAARQAHLRADRGDRAGAVAAAERAIAHWPAEPAHHLLLSQAAWELAIANPADAPAWLARAEVALTAARQRRPTDPATWWHTAAFYTAAARQFGGEAGALADDAYRRATALAPTQAALYAAWGRAHLESQNPEAAAVALRQAVSLDATHGQAYLDLGAAELALGRIEVALADYREAARLLPASGEAHAGLAHCYWLLDQPREAGLAVEAALARDPGNARAIAVAQALARRP